MKRYSLLRDRNTGEKTLLDTFGGEWIRYSDHVEAMKRIAGAPVAQGRCKIGSKCDPQTCICARSEANVAAPSASAQLAEPVYQCMCTDDDDADHNQGGKYLWMDVSKEAFEKLSAREDVRSRIVYAAPAPSASPAAPPAADKE